MLVRCVWKTALLHTEAPRKAAAGRSCWAKVGRRRMKKCWTKTGVQCAWCVWREENCYLECNNQGFRGFPRSHQRWRRGLVCRVCVCERTVGKLLLDFSSTFRPRWSGDARSKVNAVEWNRENCACMRKENRGRFNKPKGTLAIGKNRYFSRRNECFWTYHGYFWAAYGDDKKC